MRSYADLAQAAGKMPVDARLLDLASLSSHKMCGPVGVGVSGRRAEEAVRISPGRGTTVDEVERAAVSIIDAVAALRPMARRVA